MKIIWMAIALFVAVVLQGCGGGSSSGVPDKAAALGDTDLTGTWQVTEYSDVHEKTTGQYLYTDTFRSSVIITDNRDSLGVSECINHPDGAWVTVKAADYITVDPFLDPRRFMYIDPDKFQSVSETVTDRWVDPALTMERQYVMERISNMPVVDNGQLVLTGAVSVSETGHACVNYYRSLQNDSEIVEIQVPYSDRYLSLRVGFSTRNLLGTYQYSGVGAVVVDGITEFSIISNADAFWRIVGTNLLYSDDVTVVITQNDEQGLAGSFSFIAQDNSTYTGEFLIDR